jgi:hypothetical protein
MYKKPRHYPIFLHFFSGAISSYPLYLFIFFLQMQLLHSQKKNKKDAASIWARASRIYTKSQKLFVFLNET